MYKGEKRKTLSLGETPADKKKLARTKSGSLGLCSKSQALVRPALCQFLASSEIQLIILAKGDAEF
jgi:hypothetical protein